MKELQHIQFFQLRPKLRVKGISKLVNKAYEKRENNSETFDQKQARIKAIANQINKRL